jgi:hypothetical protein
MADISVAGKPLLLTPWNGEFFSLVFIFRVRPEAIIFRGHDGLWAVI